MYYHGHLRQTGGGSKGLGDIFHAFSRVLIPGMVNLYKNRSNKDYWRTKAIQQGPSILKNAVKLGVGVVSDIAKKKTLKQSLKDRGKRMISDALNIDTPPPKRQKTKSARAVKSSAKKARGRPRKKRPLDIFD